jgi:hypothetical protein
MKKTIIILLGAVVALSGCKHSEIPGEEAPVSGRRIVAEATLGNGVKSHFDTDGYNLVWDSTDKLLVYSNYLGNMDDYEPLVASILSEYSITSPTEQDKDDARVIAYFRLLRDNAAQRYTGTFSIASGGAGQTTAEFISDGPASTWMAAGEDDDAYYFASFYPAPATAPEMKAFYYEDFVDYNPMVSEAPFPYLDFTIQPVQDGVSYQDYQLLMGGAEDPSIKSALIGGEKIPFEDFKPVTSILEFTMQTSSGSGEIDHLDITLSTQEEADAAYVSNKYMIAGTVPLFFSWDASHEMRFWNRSCKPFMLGFGSDWVNVDFEATGWEGIGSDATSTLRLQFDSPVSVSESTTAQKYYAVMIPSRCIHKEGCGNPKLTFDAYNAEGKKIFTKTIETSSTQGIEEGKKYPFNLVLEDPMLGVPLTLEALEDGTTVTIANSAGLPVFQYSKDNQNWTMTTGGENSVTISLDAGECVYLKGDNPTYYISSNPTTILPDKACYIYGNIMSLVDSDDFKNCTEITGEHAFDRMFNSANILNHQTKNLLLPATKLTNSCYGQMFSGCTSLTAAPELPATELADYCYNYMFAGCTSLTAAPELPATTLAPHCYRMMFTRCTSLTTAPELPATMLASNCYYFMFDRCTSLTTAPELPATRLASNCYEGMFTSCTSLTTAPELPATMLAGNCYRRMFDLCSKLNYVKCLASRITSSYTTGWLYGVSSEGTFVKNASMTSWETGASGIPEGWTVEDAN